MSEVRIERLSKIYAGSAAVAEVSLTAAPGEFVTLLGPSGCGKSTTLRMVAGFEQPDAGRIYIGGKDVTDVPARQRGIGMVFQSYALFPNLNAYENVAFGLRVARVAEPELDRRVRDMLAAVSLEGHAQKFPAQLSGGMQQRVALARALVRNPAVLLLDEPLSALDAKIRLQLRELIKDLQARLGITTLYVTHDQEEALSLSDQVVVMTGGRVAQVGTPAEIYARPADRFVAGFVGSLNFLPPELLAGRAGVAVRPEAVRVYPAEGAPVPADGELRLTGTVVRAALLGTLVRVRVQVGGHELLADTLNTGAGTDLWPAGMPVTVAVEPGALLQVG